MRSALSKIKYNQFSEATKLTENPVYMIWMLSKLKVISGA